jgi:glyoxylase-like metal-dependent hydrolase (beta-lactamase superfamily II)
LIRLARQIYMVGGGLLGFGLSHRLDGQVYLLDGGSELALVDAGSGLGQEDILRNIVQAGFRPEQVGKILLTHEHMDHAGGAAALRWLLGCKVFAPAGAAGALRTGDEARTGLEAGKAEGFFPVDYDLEPCPVEGEVEDGAQLQVGELVLTAVATPGHSSWDMSYLLESGGLRALFCGDLVFPGGRVLIQPTPGCDPGQLRESLYRVEGLAPEALFPGHLGLCLRYGSEPIRAAAAAFRQGQRPPNLFEAHGAAAESP